ncbi:precorrin-8X methylmutase [Motilibacter rhizosphaerae]|uniref:Precorrin-8X methylmutase n=1 Tax=Motilibacter rhizosphaerae TaxID=598652 RepID=A0A4Q7NSS6_9ACTN|nr:precorrin-8X methylmutase [Motilibacter rhizosphaerae]RZS89838.1 precorrin-8X methylmutase [Motilibacter rhizosphaerae]
MPRTVHPIEVESYARMRRRVDTSALPPLTRAVVERIIHASADPAYLDDVVTDEAALQQGFSALADGATIVVDAEMVAAGITTRASVCRVRQAVASAGRTRSAEGFRLALQEVGPGAVWVVGNAPTALVELLALDARPALVVGLPVGFVGAVESKQALRKSGLPAISNISEKGGSAVASAAVNALLYHEEPA